MKVWERLVEWICGLGKNRERRPLPFDHGVEEQEVARKLRQANEENKAAARRLHKVSFEHVTRAQDVGMVIDLSTKRLRERQAEEKRVMQALREALRVSKRK